MSDKLNERSLMILEEIFQLTQLPSKKTRNDISARLKVDPKRVQTWFQSRRSKERMRLKSEICKGQRECIFSNEPLSEVSDSFIDEIFARIDKQHSPEAQQSIEEPIQPSKALSSTESTNITTTTKAPLSYCWKQTIPQSFVKQITPQPVVTHCTPKPTLDIPLAAKRIIKPSTTHSISQSQSHSIYQMVINQQTEPNQIQQTSIQSVATLSLFNAIRDGSTDGTNLALQNGANVYGLDSSNMLPLHLAVVLDRLEICALLLSVGVDVNQTDFLGRTPLYYALQFGFNSLVDLLKSYGGRL